MSLVFDISGFEALFQVNYQLLCISSYRLVQDKDIAEDIVQDVFLQLWRKRDELSLKTSVKSYLFRTTIHQSIIYNKRYNNAMKRAYTDDWEEDSSLLKQTMLLQENDRRVEIAVRALPQACRTVFTLCRYERLSYAQISSMLDISTKSVNDQMLEALKFLRLMLL